MDQDEMEELMAGGHGGDDEDDDEEDDDDQIEEAEEEGGAGEFGAMVAADRAQTLMQGLEAGGEEDGAGAMAMDEPWLQVGGEGGSEDDAEEEMASSVSHARPAKSFQPFHADTLFPYVSLVLSSVFHSFACSAFCFLLFCLGEISLSLSLVTPLVLFLCVHVRG